MSRSLHRNVPEETFMYFVQRSFVDKGEVEMEMERHGDHVHGNEMVRRMP